MRISRVKWASLLLLVSLFSSLAAVNLAAAQSDRVEVNSSTATTDFPDAITFELEATVEGVVSSVDLLYQMAALETLQLLPGEFEQDGDSISVAALADLEIAFVPVGIDVTFHWLISFEDGDKVETESTVVTWLDDRFDWERRDAPGVEVYGYETSDDFLELIVTTAAEAVITLTDLYQPSETLPIRIWVYETGEDYAGTQAANSQEWSAGSAYPDLQVIHAVIPDGSKSEVLRIIPHEVSHQILFMATRNPYNSPATWIDEGLAVLAQTGGKDFYDDTVLNAFEDDELLTMQGLISVFPFNPGEARLAYGQSYSMIRFVVETYGEESILAIVDAYAQGNSHDDVLMLALDTTLDELEAAWLASLGSANHVLAA